MPIPENGPVQSERSAETARHRMVQEQIVARGVSDSRVLEALRTVPRHLFVPPEMQAAAYADDPLPIDCGQTISQPYIVASMSELLFLRPNDRVLEIGTGSGYQTAILATLVRSVYTVEIHQELYESARLRLEGLGFRNVRFRLGDGSTGWREEAPFDRIIVTAAADEIPAALSQQLANEGRMVIPVRQNPAGDQVLVLVRRFPSGPVCETLYPVRFVPLLKSTKRPH